MRPIYIEKGGCRRAIGHTERLSGRPSPPKHPLVEPPIDRI
jgi:hypothetical protein